MTMVGFGVASLLVGAWTLSGGPQSPTTASPPADSQSATTAKAKSLPKVQSPPKPAFPPKDLRSRKQGQDWPRFLGPNYDGKSPETGIRTDWSKGLPILWQTEMGEGYAAPVTSLGRIFLFDRVKNEARLRCLHSETGEELWRRTYPTTYEDMYNYSGGPRAAPLVDESTVFIFGVDGMLQARNVPDGELIWQVETSPVYGVRQNFFGAGASPAVFGDLLLVLVGGSPKDSPGIQSGQVTSNGTGIVAFHKETGEEVYRLGNYLASYASLVLTQWDDEPWAFAFTRGGLAAFDPKAGEERFFLPWRAKMLESVNAATPVVLDRRVFITETYGPGAAMVAVENNEPRILWQDTRRQRSLASHWATPIHVDGHLYGSSGRATGNGELRSIDLKNGEVKWRERGLGRASVLFVDGHFVVLGEYGELRLVRATPESYQERGRWEPKDDQGKPLLAHPAWNAPILSHGMLYVRGKDRLLALDLIPAN